MNLQEIVLETARNLNRTSAEISVQAVPLLSNWQKDWDARWPYAAVLEASATFTTSADTQTYALSGNLSKLYAAYIPELTQRLSYLTMDQLRAIAPSNQSGPPQAFAPFGAQQVMLFPVPSASYDVNYFYYKNLDDFSTATTLSAQTPAVDPRYHEAGVQYATERMAGRMGDTDTRDYAKREYDRIFALAQADWSSRIGGRHKARIGADFTAHDTIPRNKIDQFFWG